MMNNALNWDRFASVFLLILCGILWVEAIPYSNLASLFPQVVIIVLALLSVVLLVKSWLRPDVKQLFRGIKRREVGLAVVLLALWVGLIPVLGLYVASILFFILMVWLVSKERRNFRAVGYSFLLAVVIVSFFYFIFQDILLVPFPQGILF
jgi:putative tricarboxylic transport membrane protein